MTKLTAHEFAELERIIGSFHYKIQWLREELDDLEEVVGKDLEAFLYGVSGMKQLDGVES